MGYYLVKLETTFNHCNVMLVRSTDINMVQKSANSTILTSAFVFIVQEIICQKTVLTSVIEASTHVLIANIVITMATKQMPVIQLQV